ncbi:MAG: phosphocholine cytidylyltransferase family protein [Phycisphaerales bacterium]|nr:phosphocholine cytidylyltransferase family protein [Phycisphaerales bacterium]
MKAIILAAGAGRRLGVTGPKSMIDISGQSIIHRQLDAFRAVGVDDFVIVTGYEQDRLKAHLADQLGRFIYLENPRYGETNTVYSLYLARAHINDTFYYANADVLFDYRLTERLEQAPCDSALAVQAKPCGEEEVKVVVREQRIARIGKKLDPAECLGEFVGVARFGRELSTAFVEALRITVEDEGNVNDYFERAVDRLCDAWTLTPVNINDLPCIEIDFPEDLHKARHLIAPLLATRS